MSTSFLRPSKGLLLGMLMLLLLTPALFAAQTWVVAEVFTLTTCGHCPSARSALNQMKNNEQIFPYLIPIIWQANGTHQSPGVAARANLYQVTGIPHARFAGNVRVVGGGEGAFLAYTNAYNSAAPRNAPMEIDVVATVNAQNRLVVSADFTMTGNITTQSNNAIFVVTYDLTGTMDPNYFCSAKDYEAVPFTLTEAGQQTSIVRDFAITAGWDLNKVKVAVFVQSLVQAGPIIHQGAIAGISQFEPVTVTGRVLGSDAPNGIAGAEIMMDGAGGDFDTESGADGSFRLDDVLGTPNGTDYELKITLDEYKPHLSIRRVFDENLNLGNIVLQKLSYTSVSGKVVGSDLPDGLPGATVKLTGELANYETETDGDGKFNFARVATIQEGIIYELEIFKEGYTSHKSEKEVGTTPLNIPPVQLDEQAHPVHDVVAAVSEEPNSVDLVWTTPKPITGTEQWIRWDTSDNFNGIGLTQPGEFVIASRFTPENIEELDVASLYITSVKFFFREPAATYTVKVWRGGSGQPLSPGQEITSQQAQNLNAGTWNEVVLNNPVEIIPDQEIWFGCLVNTTGGRPVGVDSGPQVNNYGNVTYLNNQWTTLSALDGTLTFNWNLQAYAGFTRGDRSVRLDQIATNNFSSVVPEPSVSCMLSNTTSPEVRFVADPNVLQQGFTSTSSTRRAKTVERDTSILQNRLLLGYDVYRFPVASEDNPDAWTFVDTAEDTTYTDEGWGIHLAPGEYKYAILASYTGDVYSDPAISNMLQNRMHSKVRVQFTSNSGDPVDGAHVTLSHVDGDPEYIYQGNAEEDDVAIIQRVWKGRYNIKARLSGYDVYQQNNVLIEDDDALVQIQLVESLQKVVNLKYELFNNNNVRLNWLEPGTVLGTPQWIHWDDGVNHDGVGLNAAAQFIAASRFTPEQLAGLDVSQLYLTAIKFYPRVAAATYTLKVWKGGSGSPLNPGEEVRSQLVTSFVNDQWNIVPLDSPVPIDPTKELWFGYYVDTPSGHPAGVDKGPVANNFGNLFFYNGQWQTLADASITFNWNLQGYAGSEYDVDPILIGSSRTRNDEMNRDKLNDRALTGYKIIRNDDIIEDDFEGLAYRDTQLTIGNYVYKIIAKYTTGESQPVITEEVIVLGTDEETEIIPLVTELQGNYPNPFNPDTKIAFTLANEEDVVIEIYNLKGQKVTTLINEKMAPGKYNVVWSGKSQNGNEVGSGIYFYQMKAGTYTTSKKMILMK